MDEQDAEFLENADELTRFATAVVGPSEAPDVVSGAFLHCVVSGRWPTVSDRRAYLYRAVLNEALATRRSLARRRQRDRHAVLAEPISTGAGAPGGPLGASYSTDSGLNWAPAIVPSVPGGPVRPATLSCASSETCMAVSWSYGAARVSLVVSDNGGESWSTVPARGSPAAKVLRAPLTSTPASRRQLSGPRPHGHVSVG